MARVGLDQEALPTSPGRLPTSVSLRLSSGYGCGYGYGVLEP